MRCPNCGIGEIYSNWTDNFTSITDTLGYGITGTLGYGVGYCNWCGREVKLEGMK